LADFAKLNTSKPYRRTGTGMQNVSKSDNNKLSVALVPIFPKVALQNFWQLFCKLHLNLLMKQ
jgi:hypothetical protein